MSQTTQDAWFYTCEGEKIGPVTLAELRVKAHEGVLNPRLDMVWGTGMAEWKPSGEIEGLFERRNTPGPQQLIEPTTDPYQPPITEEFRDETMGQGADWPGARRRSFLTATILFPMIWQFALTFTSGFASSSFGPDIGKMILIGAGLVPAVVGIYFSLMRLVNLGMSRWWYLGHFVPFLNLWVGYRSFACPAGYAYHKQLDGIGVALAIFYWLLVVIATLAVVALVAVFFGAVGNPEMQQQIENFILHLESMQKNPASP